MEDRTICQHGGHFGKRSWATWIAQGGQQIRCLQGMKADLLCVAKQITQSC